MHFFLNGVISRLTKGWIWSHQYLRAIQERIGMLEGTIDLHDIRVVLGAW
jgi:hypothetical protein